MGGFCRYSFSIAAGRVCMYTETVFSFFSHLIFWLILLGKHFYVPGIWYVHIKGCIARWYCVLVLLIPLDSWCIHDEWVRVPSSYDLSSVPWLLLCVLYTQRRTHFLEIMTPLPAYHHAPALHHRRAKDWRAYSLDGTYTYRGALRGMKCDSRRGHKGKKNNNPAGIPVQGWCAGVCDGWTRYQTDKSIWVSFSSRNLSRGIIYIRMCSGWDKVLSHTLYTRARIQAVFRVCSVLQSVCVCVCMVFTTFPCVG